MSATPTKTESACGVKAMPAISPKKSISWACRQITQEDAFIPPVHTDGIAYSSSHLPEPRFDVKNVDKVRRLGHGQEPSIGREAE